MLYRLTKPLFKPILNISSRQWSDRNDSLRFFAGLDDSDVTCLTLHPVCFPNHGPKIELSLASEALGLARSLDWEIVEGPTKVNIIKNDTEQNLSDEEETSDS